MERAILKRWALSLAVVALGCSGDLPMCKIQCGATIPACPSGMACGQDGYCYASGERQTCRPWFEVGPFTGSVLAADEGSDRVLAGGRVASIGLFASSSGGESWSRLFDGQYVYAALFDPSDPSFAYVGTNGGLVRIPVAGGMPQMVLATSVKSLVADAAGTVYAGTGARSVYRRSAGAGFVKLTELPSSVTDVNALALGASSPAVIFAGTDRGLYRSTDEGASWTLLGSGLPSVAIAAVAVDPAGATVYAGATNGLYRSTDGGASFVPLAGGLPNGVPVQALVLDPRNPQAVYVGTRDGLFETRDGGATFAVRPLLDSPVSVGALVLLGSGMLYVGTDAGVLKLRGEGPAARVSTGLGEFVTPQQVAVSTGGEAIYVATVHGAYRSLTAGQSFARIFSAQAVSSVAVDPGATGYVGTRGNGVYKVPRMAGGRFVNMGLPCVAGTYYDDCLDVTAVMVDPTDPLVVYLGTRAGLKGSLPAGLYRTSNGGDSWSGVRAMAAATTNGIAVGGGGARIFYAATTAGVVRSFDGTTWDDFSDGLPALAVLSVAVGPDGTGYAGTDGGGLYRVGPGQNRWTVVASPATNVLALALEGAQVIYLGSPSGIHKSEDGGANWNQVYADAPVRALTPDTGHPGTVFAAGKTILKTTSGGVR